MKNMSVSWKMVLSYAVMTLLCIAICAMGLWGMHSLNNAVESLHENIIIGTEHITQMRNAFQSQRVQVQLLALSDSDASAQPTIIEKIRENDKQMVQSINAFQLLLQERNIFGADEALARENEESFALFQSYYHTFFEPQVSDFVESAGSINYYLVKAFINSEKAVQMSEALDMGYSYFTDLSSQRIVEADALYSRMRVSMILFTLVVIAVSIFLGVYLPTNVAVPLSRMVKVADAVAVGDMEVPVLYLDRGDEVGKLSQAFQRMKDEIAGQIHILESLADGDLTVQPTLRGEKDTLGQSLVLLSTNLNDMISEVTKASDGVALESKNVAAQSQELAQGTTEQAASVEQLSSAFFQISLNTKESASLAGKAAELSDNVKRMAVEGEAMMAQMIQAVQDADTASQSIAKINKVIEEISFQTNILSLNAAVEAAHAGQHGSGFAVVASEVRNLASKNTASAKETSDLIANALEKVQLGADIAGKTSESFQRIVQGIIDSTKLISDIAKSSEEQALAIEQMNTGISQVAQVIHLNSGAAEKCASAAERMTAQARDMEDMVTRFKTDDTAADLPPQEGPSGEVVAMPAHPPTPPAKIELLPTIPSNDFGKY